jgi:energy-coupling factor transporter ATP-binding protein EcfA2
MTKLGLLDRPIDSIAQDTLKLEEHAQALARFIRQCDTAMTIAIQGDWGSGKTSMMRMIEHILKDETKVNERIRKTIRINTWELAQFGQAENLPILLLSSLVGELADSGDPNKSIAVRKLVGVVGRGLAVAVGTALGQGEAVRAGLDHAVSEVDAGPTDMVDAVQKMKKGLENLVTEATKGGDGARVVVFIDDLDRLVPVRAVELLEVMKVFLDVPGCVFVLACDYQVVMKGLTEKFGVSEAQLSGKSFFDKIIQVPYCMPLHRYDVNQYMEAILRSVSDEAFGTKDIALYRRLTEKSVGFNPRGLKRIMNALVLMNDVTDKDRRELPDGLCTQHEWIRILFAILCLQQSYPALFRFMCEQTLTQEWLEGLDQEYLQANEALKRLVKKDGAPDPDWQTMAEFCDVFNDAIQLEADGNSKRLSADELRVLQKLLDSSNIVAVQPAAGRGRARDFEKFREDFLGQCDDDAEAKAFFTDALQYVLDAGIANRPGGVGISLQDKTNKSRVHRKRPTPRVFS